MSEKTQIEINNESYGIEELPKEALAIGTVCRSKRFDGICIIVDAFYGDTDADNQKIIIYTVLLFPSYRFELYSKSTELSEGGFYMSNELEYDIIAYLMIPSVDITKYSSIIRGGLL
ncbi:MAG: hypothetical protein NZ735_09320 [Candidatus Marinimicrobia bacterium]|nr:hypothetical protein [Candidatus Neomarinimicrobiota bacterium]